MYVFSLSYFFFIWFLGKNLCASILMYKGSELSHQI